MSSLRMHENLTAPPNKSDKADLFGVLVSPTTYEHVIESVILAGHVRKSMTITALATHGLMTANQDPAFREVVNSLDVVTPDGQPVRWALNRFHNAELSDRVYGPKLMWEICRSAAEESIPVFLFGSTQETLDLLLGSLSSAFPSLKIAGSQADRFRDATPAEDIEDVQTICESGAGILFVGRGCPLQERWIAEHADLIDMPMIAVGAAFDYHAGLLRTPPELMQRFGLEWLWRLGLEPKRLWRRYVSTNSQFVVAWVRAELDRR